MAASVHEYRLKNLVLETWRARSCDRMGNSSGGYGVHKTRLPGKSIVVKNSEHYNISRMCPPCSRRHNRVGPQSGLPLVGHVLGLPLAVPLPVPRLHLGLLPHPDHLRCAAVHRHVVASDLATKSILTIVIIIIVTRQWGPEYKSSPALESHQELLFRRNIGQSTVCSTACWKEVGL